MKTTRFSTLSQVIVSKEAISNPKIFIHTEFIHLMIKAYILILTYVGNLKSVLNEMKNLKNVESIAVIAGDYDIVVKANVNNLEELMELTDKIHSIKGVKRTNTQVIEKEIEI